MTFIIHSCLSLYSLQVQKTGDTRFKHLNTACTEVTKFEDELHKFKDWLTDTSDKLAKHEQQVKSVDTAKQISGQQEVGFSLHNIP